MLMMTIGDRKREFDPTTGTENEGVVVVILKESVCERVRERERMDGRDQNRKSSITDQVRQLPS